MKKKLRIVSRIVFFIIMVAGIVMAAYPWISNYLYENRAQSEVNAYAEAIENASANEILSEKEAAQAYNDAIAYNASLASSDVSLGDAMSGEELTDEDCEYASLLNLSGSGCMAYIDIPSIGVYLPIYHGTDSSTLLAGVGHLKGSSLPVGGESTHAVLSAHTGLSSAKMFDDLTELVEGDLFYIHVLDEILAYEVIDIRVVLPSDTEYLNIEEGEDLVTLVTCTPYGINSHRLFVTGTRTEYIESEYEEAVAAASQKGSTWLSSYKQALLLGVGIVALTLAIIGFLKLLKNKQAATKVRVFFGIIIMIVGAGLYFYPTISEYVLNATTDALVDEFNEKYGIDESEPKTDADTAYEDNELYQACIEYNNNLVKNGQSGLVDAWSYETAGIDLDGLEDEMFGYIYIPAMDVTLPIYLGASTSNMAKGAAVLGQTSIPIGGTSTNAVIAGHRGYRGSPYFREIEELSIGDLVYVTNPWGTLTYQVSEIDIVAPSDKEAVKIQAGKDMITLLTCHPYRSHGKYRYLVYCERVEDDATAEIVEEDTSDTITSSDGITYTLSSSDIQMEDMVRKICGILIAVIAIVSIASAVRRYIRKKRKEI